LRINRADDHPHGEGCFPVETRQAPLTDAAHQTTFFCISASISDPLFLSAGAVLAGELSLMSALAAGQLVRSHMQFNRSNSQLAMMATAKSADPAVPRKDSGLEPAGDCLKQK
jgi:hypothetical protein